MVCIQADSAEGGEYYVDDESTEFDNSDCIGNDETDDVTDEDQQAHSAAIGQRQY